MTADKYNNHRNVNQYDQYNHYKPAPVNKRNTDTSMVRIKVEEDIAFLRARIQLMESHPRPNRIVLDTYQGMLNSRIAVLKWLLHGHDDGDLSSQATIRSA